MFVVVLSNTEAWNLPAVTSPKLYSRPVAWTEAVDISEHKAGHLFSDVEQMIAQEQNIIRLMRDENITESWIGKFVLPKMQHTGNVM